MKRKTAQNQAKKAAQAARYAGEKKSGTSRYALKHRAQLAGEFHEESPLPPYRLQTAIFGGVPVKIHVAKQGE
ncbi:MAG: hypothetical protein PHQ43_01025 [Dehalococcoidales bacterium]|nr:hypothetical protein [Dehalococcoidales bacterium]